MPSSVIRRFAWRAEESALDVEFTTGRIYRYHGVPESVARRMRSALSKGSFFNREVRGSFAHSRLRSWPTGATDHATSWGGG